MEFLSVGQEAQGFIAIGQHARGVIALGQTATGVIAVGQLARGVFTIGQAAFGFVGWGQAGLGIFHAIGMMGAGGRGVGLVLRLTPGVGRPRVLPETIPIERALGGDAGWIKVDLFYDAHGLGLGSAGRRLPIKLDRRLQRGASSLTVHGPREVSAYVVVKSGVAVCERIQHSPPRPYESAGFYTWAAVQFAGLLALATAWWVFVGRDLLSILGEFIDI